MPQTSETRNRTSSQQWFVRAQQSLVDGVNSPSRGPAVYSPGPIVLERGHGSRVWDADGNEYVDFMMSFGALIQGHAHPTLVKTVSSAMAEGSHFAAATSAEVEAAERFRRMVPSAEVVVLQDGKPLHHNQATKDTRFRTGANGAEESYVVVDSARMYFLVDNHEFGPHDLELRCSAGVAAFAFTFTSCVDPVASALQTAVSNES